jgi:threonyl-tRNA synthetase
MKTLLIHADKVSYEVTAPTKVAEPLTEELRRGEMANALWARVALEKGDEDNESVLRQAASDIAGVCGQVKTKNVLLYPYAHLLFGSEPASPRKAIAALLELEKLLKEAGLAVKRAPFGHYKKFSVECKGHPLSELSRVITAYAEKKEARPAEKVSESLKQEAKVKSRFYVMTPDGKLTDVEKFDFQGHEDLKKFADYEIHKVRAYAQEPVHVKLMKEQGIAQFEPASDAGHLRWPPKGKLVKKLLERKVTDMVIDYGGMEMEGPIMFDYEHPALKKYLNRFPARQYVVQSDNRELFTVFSACFSQFLMLHDAQITYKHLPARIYWLLKYAFRKEQSGEVTGLKRLRCFTMPDMHTFCRDFGQALEEFERQFELCERWMSDVQLPYEVAFRAQTEFFEKNKEWYLRVAKRIGRPFLFEMFDERYAYFISKFEFNFVDSQAKGTALSTVQIDVENSETFDITYVDEDGKKKHGPILHASISGSTDRVVYALLEKEGMKIARGETPSWPLWLAPMQLRLIPIAERHLPFAEQLLKQLKSAGVRADVDDRNERLDRKIRDAEHEWVQAIVAIGDREAQGGELTVRLRGSKEQQKFTLARLIEHIRSGCAGQPFEPLPLPDHLSRRPSI